MVRIPVLPTAFTLACAAGAMGQSGGGAPADQKARAEAVELAKTTLSRGRSIKTADMKVESVTAVQWQDTSLGCPMPDMMYAQRLVSGYKIVLRAAETSYDVHVGEGQAVICEKGSPSGARAQPASRPKDEAGRTASRLAREALASARGVPLENVVVKRVRPFKESDTRCRPPAAAPAGAGPAYLVELSLGDSTFEYYADQKSAYACDAPHA